MQVLVDRQTLSAVEARRVRRLQVVTAAQDDVLDVAVQAVDRSVMARQPVHMPAAVAAVPFPVRPPVADAQRRVHTQSWLVPRRRSPARRTDVSFS
jgi:hypothetical protein